MFDELLLGQTREHLSDYMFTINLNRSLCSPHFTGRGPEAHRVVHLA